MQAIGLKIRSIALVFGIGLVFLSWPAFPAKAAPHNMTGWAWSGTTGWVSFNCNDPKPGYPTGDCEGPGGDYGVDIVDRTGNLEGWAWSTNAGWICFGATCVGVSPPGGTPSVDHYCPGHTPCARYEPSDGQLHGWAYIIGETASPYRGWISLNCTDVDPNTALPLDCGAGVYGVDLDMPSGNFSGFAWNGNGDTTGSGWLQWACDVSRPCAGAAEDWGVSTGWVLSGWSAMTQQEGIYTNDPPPAAGTHLTSIPMVFEDFSAAAGTILRCYLRASDGASIVHDTAIAARTAEVPVFSADPYTIAPGDASADLSGNPVLWTFSTPTGLPGTPPAYGCEITGPSGLKKAVPNQIAVHPHDWVFTGPGGPTTSDSNRANFCLAGNLGSDPARAWFQNTSQCDTEGDLALSLLKAKGIAVEVYCRDNLDDDANFQKDCDGGIPVSDPDRSCRGVTYLCITHPAAPTTDPPQP